MKTTTRLICTLQILLIVSIISSFAQQKAKSTGYAPVNGLKMYYEIHGEGKPIVLLHGAYMTIDLNWSQVIPELSKTRKVIAVEMQGHGRTADIDRSFSFSSSASDIASLLKHFKIDKADVLGYSFGGTVALQLAIQNPELVDRLIIISTAYKYEGWLPEVRNVLASLKPNFLDNTPLKPAHDAISPNPKHWNDFVAKFIKFDTQSYDLGDENIKAIKSPVLFIMGDNDGVDINHKAKMYQLCGGNVFGDMSGLPKSQLMILPAATHVGLMMDAAKMFSTINSFLDKQPEAKR